MASINIRENGVVEYKRVSETGEIWRTTLTPGDVERAKKLLTKAQFAQVEAAWTATVFKAWQKMLVE